MQWNICAHACRFCSIGVIQINRAAFLQASRQQLRRKTVNRHSPAPHQINFPMITSRYPPPMFFLSQIYNANNLQRPHVWVCVIYIIFRARVWCTSRLPKNYSFLKNDHPWVQENMGQEQEEEEMKFDSLSLCARVCACVCVGGGENHFSWTRKVCT